MKAEKDFVNTMVGLIFIVLIGVAFFLLFQEQIMAIATSVFDLVKNQFDALTPPAGYSVPFLGK